MMDIVERLQWLAGNHDRVQAANLMAEAAAEIVKLRAALAQQEQAEPHELLCLCGATWSIKGGKEELVAAPPQRKPLTDEQIDAITKERWGSQLLGVMVAAHREYARAVERAHKIGGDDE